MARIFAYCDSPEAATGFGRSAHHVLHALHRAGHTIVQLAVNHDINREDRIPWKVYSPTRRDSDPYGLWDLPAVLQKDGPFDMLWTTFDPEIPWAYVLPGIPDQKVTVLDLLRLQKKILPGFKMMGWFPVDGGPLSGYELGVLTNNDIFDLKATMSTHVLDLVQWTHKLMGNVVDMEQLGKRLKVVPHGVDLDLYRIVTDEERARAKEILGFPPDTFLVTQVERNQQRKQVWRAMEVLEKLRLMLPGKSIHLYQHMHVNEESEHARVGWKMDELAWRYGLKAGKDVQWRTNGRFYTEKEMVDLVYGAADVVLSVSAGEGFQYPLWEALACGRRVVAPQDSARKAWLQHTPGVHLYKADEHGEVVRGGYNRRMSRPDITDACRIIKKMVEGRQKFQEVGESSRSWVERTADVNFVKQWWVDQAEKMAEELVDERREQGFTVHGTNADHVISLRAGPGLGDLLMMVPALQAFMDAHPEETVTLAVPRNDNHVELAMLFSPCTNIQMEDRVPLEKLGKNVVELSKLWKPLHTGGWSDPTVHRTDAVAAALGVEVTKAVKIQEAEKHTKATQAHFVQRYGVHPTNCVAICAESHATGRNLPEAYVLTVAERIINLGLTPVLVGGKRAACARVGILNITGQTDLGGLIGIMGSMGAVISVDSAPLHIAAIQGTPVVALMPLFSAETRLTYYPGDIEVVRPEADELNGETYPAGKDGSDAWVSELSPRLIMAALQRLIGAEADDAPKVITAADLGPEVGSDA